MADFVSLHPEEWAGLIDGLYFSSMISTVLPIFLPVVIFAIGLSLFIWLYRLEREGEFTNFILWLVVSSVLLIAAFKKTTVNVELSPIVLVNPQAIQSFKNVEKDEKKKTFIYRVEASGASALLAIPDKLASLFFNFLDEGFVRKVSKQSKTVPIDYLACMDPRYATATIQTLVLTEVFDLSADKGQDFKEFQKKVISFKKCYEQNFEGSGFAVQFNLSWEKLGSALAKAGGAAFTVFKFTKNPIITFGAGVIGFGEGLFQMVSWSSEKCSNFLEAYKRLAEQFAEACDREFLKGLLGEGKGKEEMRKTFANIVLACVKNPEDDKSGFCSNLKNNTLYALDQAQKLSNVQTTLGGGIKDYLSKVVSDIKAWWYTITYMDFPLKVALLAKGQGIVLALLTGIFPFIVVLSIIPTGRHFINWPLLLKFGVAYFLVKLWLPLLYFVVNIAVHLYAGLSMGG
ncbi:MAG: hypothetical protein ACO2PP_03580 [Thermocrinis sp.]|jgi:hypothetical protein|uniref:hypothetical protein n=1 Tax=Thermocrinis sp. TaxID=2024383 RepID=UPI003C088C80